MEPYADVTSIGLGVAFLAAAFIGIVKPRIEETLRFRKDIPDMPPLDILGVEIRY